MDISVPTSASESSNVDGMKLQRMFHNFVHIFSDPEKMEPKSYCTCGFCIKMSTEIESFCCQSKHYDIKTEPGQKKLIKLNSI